MHASRLSQFCTLLRDIRPSRLPEDKFYATATSAEQGTCVGLLAPNSTEVLPTVIVGEFDSGGFAVKVRPKDLQKRKTHGQEEEEETNRRDPT